MATAKRVLLAVGLLAVLAGGGYAYWRHLDAAPTLPAYVVETNGRVEAQQFDIASKVAGRVLRVLVEEGQMVEAGAVVARLDDATMQAQLRAAEAQIQEATQAVAQAQAELARASSMRQLAQTELGRTQTLAQRGYAPTEQLDQRRAALEVADATVATAEAGQRRAAATQAAAQANAAQVRTVLQDMVLTAPRAGRVLYRLVRDGEVVAAGGRVATLIDPTDVSMIVFLPADQAGKQAYGAEARLVLDPVPQYVLPATVSFVAPEAQFTPRQVETATERGNLMFRVKLRIPETLLRAHAEQVKGGVRGLAYLRLDPAQPWPDRLQVRLP
ncbi:HlyD family efflux transporter periplasmic adaptor subunit [Roseomonas sp. NAR14]|uniref:HlyD family efflux transporter periplasmic adaptor subunit n=1 Tax=Roseomonas acroporae TaxID=2937791 RepID=A0A9X1YEM6_9PROT|nr:HlyD family efflux transporter periplasmic adaptor subunit [Roseomonas acroporae]MCK8787685.1 HlyD family efflux transporter periplasmic adaptor subunit [Roseomonas acroporae]